MGATCASNGDHHNWLNGSKKSGISGKISKITLDLLCAKQDNKSMEKAKNPHAQALGSLGGKARAEKLPDAEIAKIASTGGKARAAILSAAERSRIAKLGVAARERKRKGKE